MSEKVWNGTEYVEVGTSAAELAARLKEIATLFRNGEPRRVVGKVRLYEMTEEIRDHLAETLEEAATLISEAYEVAEA